MSNSPKIAEIPGKMISTWEEDVKSVLDSWTDYNVSLEDFKQAVFVTGVKYFTAHSGVAWIVDSSVAKGSFSKEIQNFIQSDGFPIFNKAGLKFFITVLPKEVGITTLTVRNYSSKADPFGIELVEAKTVEDAKEWLNDHADK